MSDLIVWQTLKEQANALVESGFLPKAVDTWQKATAIMMYGKEMGIGPMESMQSIDVIQGKPTQKPQSMKAMVHKKLPGAVFRIVKTNDEGCAIEAARPGDPVMIYTFSKADAERLGYQNKDNWKKQPKVMLQWRCIGYVSRTVFPDCLSGVSYTPEELGAEVDADHNVIKINPQTIIDQPIETPVTPPIDIKEINKEADAAKEAQAKKEAQSLLLKKIAELTDSGWKTEEILKKLNLTNLSDLKDSKQIMAALEVLHDAE